MNLLAIDTSTENASIALSIKGELRSAEQGAQRQHAQLLLPMIEKLLADAQAHVSQLDAIIFGRGPGSFTGLRIACSVAKGLAFGHDLPLYPVSSLAAIASETFATRSLPAATCVLAVIDARMNQLYWACYDDKITTSSEQVSDAEDILIDNEQPLILAGIGYQPYVQNLPETTQLKIEQDLSIFPYAQAMIRLVTEGKIESVNAEEASPVYIRNQIAQGDPRG